MSIADCAVCRPTPALRESEGHKKVQTPIQESELSTAKKWIAPIKKTSGGQVLTDDPWVKWVSVDSVLSIETWMQGPSVVG